MLVVWFLTGFWHGASWNYILWGLYYFVLLAFEKIFLLDKLKKAPAFVSHIYTLFFVLFGWLLFVFEDLSAGMVWLGNMFGANVAAFANMGDLYNLTRNLIFFVILGIASTPLPKKLYTKFVGGTSVAKAVASAGGIVMMIVCIAYLVDSTFNPFLYFRF